MSPDEWLASFKQECAKRDLPKLIEVKIDGPRIDWRFADHPTENCFVILVGWVGGSPAATADWYLENRPK